MMNNNILDLINKLCDVENGTIIISIEIQGGSLSLEIDSFRLNKDTKILELSSFENNTLFQIDTTKILDCVRYEEVDGYRYHINFDSWSADISIV